ncbi:MAG: MutS-related protein, partial [Acetobacteraceae bacterium]
SVVFLHEVAEGAAGRSWGVHVAELAGVPTPVVHRAASLLAMLEKQAAGPLTALPLFAASGSSEAVLSPSVAEPDPLATELAALQPDWLTPLQALDALYRLKSLVPVSDASPT